MGSAFVVVLALLGVVCAVRAPMFLAQYTVLGLCALHFWDTLQERDHLPLVGVSLIGLALLLVRRKGLLNAFESFKKLTHALRYHILGEFILGLPSIRAHTKDVTR